MSSFVGISDQIIVGQLDLTSKASRIDFGPLTRAMKDFTTFADGGFTCVLPGLINGEATVKGFQDFATDVLDDDLSIGQLGSQYPITAIPNASGTVTAGDPAWLSRGVVSELNPLEGAKGDPAGFTLKLPFDTICSRALVAHPTAARTANGNGTAVPLAGPNATQRLYACLHVLAYSGFTNVVFKIQSDNAVGFPSSTDRITFGTVTARGSEFASVAGDFSTETHQRVSWTVSGVGSITFICAFGVL